LTPFFDDLKLKVYKTQKVHDLKAAQKVDKEEKYKRLLAWHLRARYFFGRETGYVAGNP
jgi:hypothetical protein